MRTVRTSKELGKAIKENESVIVVEGDIVNSVYKLKVISGVAWTIAIGAIGSAIYLYLSAPAAAAASAPLGGSGAAIPFTGGLAASSVAVTILGFKATTVAIAVGVSAGGVGAVSAIKNKYEITEKSYNRAVLKRKMS
ncbi:MAG: hypothetical protein ACYDG2_17685 [Ruminiclostridium sp.]